MVVFTQACQIIRVTNFNISPLRMSLSDTSDLTDLSTDEDDVPLAKRTSKAKKAPKEYKITHALHAPRTAQYTAKSLYGMFTCGGDPSRNVYCLPAGRPDH